MTYEETLAERLCAERERYIRLMMRQYRFDYGTSEEVYSDVMIAVLRNRNAIQDFAKYVLETVRNMGLNRLKARRRETPRGHGPDLEAGARPLRSERPESPVFEL